VEIVLPRRSNWQQARSIHADKEIDLHPHGVDQVPVPLSGVGGRFFVRFGGVLMGLGRVFVRFCGVLVCLLVVARFMVRGGFVMMFGCLLVMLCCFVVCFDCHVESSTWGMPRRASKHTANTTVDRLRQRFTVFTSGSNLAMFRRVCGSDWMPEFDILPVPIYFFYRMQVHVHHRHSHHHHVTNMSADSFGEK
jgi:hypothetical protein